ncbi:MAG TPA: peptide deformylase [bacterium]|nr:peptide deformylase [bacterium]
MRIARSLAILIAIWSIISCATAKPIAPCAVVSTPSAAVAATPSPFDRYERRLITGGAENEVMTLVTDDTPAGNAFLREKAFDIDPNDPLLPLLRSRMLETVKKAPGVGVAAPQVGISRRAAWIQRMDKPEKPFEFYVNPRIDEYAPEKATGWEGCLSVPAGFGSVERSTWVVVTHDIAGKGRISERIEGFTAVIFQHELDHLDGILFVDRKLPGELMPKEAYYEMRRKEKEEKEAAAQKEKQNEK